MAKWYYIVDGQETGPMEPAELKRLADSGHLKPHDKLRREDMTKWHQASDVKGLFTFRPSHSGPSSVIAAITSAAPDQAAAPKTNGANVSTGPTPRSGASENGSKTKANTQIHPPYDGLDGSANSSNSTDTTSPQNPHITDGIHERVSSVWTDLRTLNFWEEIVPIDSTNFGRMLKDPVILAVTGAAIAPLVIITLPPDLQLTAFAMLFAFIWGMVFKHYIIRATASWKTLLSASFFTGVIGIRAPLLLSRIYFDTAQSPNILLSLFGCIFGIGICEELCKILPVVVYLLWKRQNAVPKLSILIGVFSGLGFAAFENLKYARKAVLDTFGLTFLRGPSGLREGVEGAMVNVLLRSLSCVFCHAVFTGIFAYFVTLAFLTGRKYIALTIAGLAVAATLHGVYDWLTVVQQTFAAALMAGSFVLFYAYLLKLQALTENSRGNDLPSPAA